MAKFAGGTKLANESFDLKSILKSLKFSELEAAT